MKTLRRPGIRSRIALSYILTIGLAATGIQLGQRFAHTKVQQPAHHMLEAAYQQAGTLSELQKNLLQAKNMAWVYVQRPELLNDYSYHLFNGAQQLQQLLDDLAATNTATLEENKTENSPAVVAKGSRVEATPQNLANDKITTFLGNCQQSGQTYEGALSELLEQLETAKAASASADAIQLILLKFTRTEAVSQLETCSLELESLIFQNQNNILQASHAFTAAAQLQSRITTLSLMLSLAAAITLALLNSWAITRPLTTVSEVARKVAKNSDFDLQVPVTTHDEVGVVASSLNTLIQRVKQLLLEQQIAKEQLETYNATLEFTVQSRTQEIFEKKASLEQTVKDLNEAQSQLVQAEKMSSLGQLVAGIAHEINNPVNFIHGNLKHAESYFQDLREIIELYATHGRDSDIVKDKLEEADLEFLEEDAIKLLKSMRMGTERIREIVLSLRNFSRLDESDRKTVDIHEGIDSTLLILGHRLKGSPSHPNISIVKQYGSLPLVECFPGQLNQVFMNILANAIDAFESNTKQANPQITISTVQIEDNRIRVAIADNGTGIPDEVLTRIFEPFFTTKDIGKGTGMGLSISYKIITERHQGTLRCESAAGQGTTFWIELPIQAKVSAHQTTPSHQSKLVRA